MEPHEHPLIQEHVDTLLRRIQACSFTIATVRDSIFDPITVDTRADLLIATEDLVNEAMTLALEIRQIAWSEADLAFNEKAQKLGNE